MKEQLIIDFFNFDMPCPEKIPFCSQLREKYQEELNKLNSTGCSACKRSSLKSKYIKEVWENFIINNT
jgi:hypothetical protein